MVQHAIHQRGRLAVQLLSIDEPVCLDEPDNLRDTPRRVQAVRHRREGIQILPLAGHLPIASVKEKDANILLANLRTMENCLLHMLKKYPQRQDFKDQLATVQARIKLVRARPHLHVS